ncbi:MAG TPA: DHA2 family efflux MFS transporter permease subunit [Anaerolineae bacterium]|nr:DHA2 family efflux MFS transporter permease subunit [Anaerolineae bacterium]
MTTTSEMTYKESRNYQRRWWALVVVILAVIAIGLDQTVLNVAIPTLQRELGATASELIWMVDAYIVVFAATLLVCGALGDRYGRAKAFYLGLIIFGLSSLGAAYSQTSGQLIASRAVMGVSGALLMTSTLSIVTNVFPREERGRAIGIWAGVSAMGIFLGPVIGGALLENYWWGSVFLINVPLAAVALIAGLFLVPDSKDPHAGTIDYPGFILSMGAISLLVYGIIEAPSRGWTDPVVLATLAASVPLTIAFIWWELRVDNPLLDLSFFKNPRFSAGVSGTSLASFARLGAGFGLTQYLQFVQDYTPLEAGVRMLPLVLGIAVGAGFSDRLVKRLGTNWVVSGGLLLLAGGLAAFVFWQPETAYWIVGVNLFLVAFGVGNVMAPSTDAVMGAVPEEKAGVGSAMNGVARMVAGALGAAIIGSLMYTMYSNMMTDAVAALPPEAAAAASDSVGAAMYLAESLPAPYGQALASEAAVAFTDSFGWAILIGAAVALVAAVVVAIYMPPQHLEESEVEHSFEEPVTRPVIQTG